MAPLDYNLEQPWVRQPFDGDLDWALFQDYLTLSGRPRSLRALARVCPLNVTQLENLAWEKGWTARANRWDQHLEGVRQKAIETEIQETAKDVARRHGKLAKKALGLAEKELDKYIKASNEAGDMPGLLTPRDLIRFLFLGVRTERLVIGEASARVEGTFDVSNLSVDELRALRDMQEKTRAL